MELNKNIFTVLGILSMIIWSSNVYFTKYNTNNFGNFTYIGICYTTAGIIGGFLNYSFEYLSSKYVTKTTNSTSENTLDIENQNQNPKITNNYLIFIYFLLVLNCISIPTSYALTNNKTVIMSVIILTNTWTIIINVLLVLIVGYKVKSNILFIIGIISGLIGLIISVAGFELSKDILLLIPKYWYCYILGINNSISWSIYSVLLIKYNNIVSKYHTFYCFFISGVISFLIALCLSEYKNYNSINISFISIGIILYSSLIVNALAYLLWNIGYTFGNSIIISNVSVLMPLLSIIFISVFYNISLLNNNLYGSIFLVICLLIFKFIITKD